LRPQAVGLRSAGGTFGGARKPCEFLCLILKLLQLQPDKEIIIEYIRNEEFKYVRILGEWQRRGCLMSATTGQSWVAACHGCCLRAPQRTGMS